jgi:tRNA(Leu) C34 or U34 (ribose-2'-O)-methylase TrmL
MKPLVMFCSVASSIMFLVKPSNFSTSDKVFMRRNLMDLFRYANVFAMVCLKCIVASTWGLFGMWHNARYANYTDTEI